MKHKSFRTLLVLAVLLVFAIPPVYGETSEAVTSAADTLPGKSIVIHNTVMGKTPFYMGENTGNANGIPTTESNVEWIKNLGINAARTWVLMALYEPENDNGPYGNGVTDGDSFLTAKNEVIADPEHNSKINWAPYRKEFKEALDVYLTSYKENGITPLLVLRNNRVDWFERPTDRYEDYWEFWEFAFAVAYHAYKEYGFLEFEIENEPNIPPATAMPIKEYTRLAEFGSDAVRTAVSLLNSEAKPKIYTPALSNSINADYLSYLSGTLLEKGEDGRPGDFYSNGISFHSYAPPDSKLRNTPVKAISDIQNVIAGSNPDGQVEDMYITEANIAINGVNSDLPVNGAKLGRLAIQSINQGKDDTAGHSWLRGFLKFKLFTNPYSQGDNTSIGATAESGDEFEREHLFFSAYRLIVDATKGAKDVLDQTTDFSSDEALVTRDDRYVYLLNANWDKTAKKVSVETLELGIGDAPVYVNSVAGDNWGTVSELQSENGGFQYTLPAESLLLLRIPLHQTEKTLDSIDITPSSEVILKHRGAKEFKATARYTDGTTEDISDRVTWQSSDESSVRILPSGLAYGVKSGSSSFITAVYGKQTSKPVAFHVLDTYTETFHLGDYPNNGLPDGWADLSKEGNQAEVNLKGHQLDLATTGQGQTAAVEYGGKAFNLKEGPVTVELFLTPDSHTDGQIALFDDKGNHISVTKSVYGQLKVDLQDGTGFKSTKVVADTGISNLRLKAVIGPELIRLYENDVYIGAVKHRFAATSGYKLRVQSTQTEGTEPQRFSADSLYLYQNTLNQDPSAEDAQVRTDKHSAITGRTVAVDPDGDALTYRAEQQPQHGTLQVEADGDWVYTPVKNYRGADSFTILVQDGKGGLAISQVSIEVINPGNGNLK